MKPEKRSYSLLGVTRSKAKMYEYGVDEQSHINITRDPARLFTLTIGMLGELAARITSGSDDEEYIEQLQKKLVFSAQFFDTYIQAKLDESMKPYLLLMGSAAYYLCDLPGSSKVLISQLSQGCPELDCNGLEKLLHWLLQDSLQTFDIEENNYKDLIKDIVESFVHFSDFGKGEESLFTSIVRLRKNIYNSGTARELLFADVIGAVAIKRYKNSTWYCLPRYTGITLENWSYIIQNDSFIKELWPSQRLLGVHGVYNGRSAVVQMPTSAGKTKATEIIIRSAFMASRTSLSVIVAPFRALCHEIRDALTYAFESEDVEVNELTDVMQNDFETESSFRRVIVATPEKLLYLIRHNPHLIDAMGLLIFDEGHQFDSGKRGVTYELLLSSMKMMISPLTQTVLISAVISNAEAIENWLNDGQGEVVNGANLSPTYRTVAFTSWLDQTGRLQFINQENPDEGEFFVPRIIERHELSLRGRERRNRVFPEKGDGRSISLYLGLKLVKNGSVAIFCGTKVTASSMCEKIVDAYSRDLPTNKPIQFSDEQEIKKIQYMFEKNLGPESYATRSAEIGILAHHSNIPHGIRLAVEHALKEGLARFVVCTSTLAQGVNLPLRYLIVSGVYQGRERIKVRDFHNLIGRAGRSGMYTEGSILFADTEIYDSRDGSDGWRWKQVKELLNPQNSEPCLSTLFSIFEPLTTDNQKVYIEMDPLEIASIYIENPSELDLLPEKIVNQYPEEDFSIDGIRGQIRFKLNIISAIESYIMSYLIVDEESNETEVSTLVQGTLAHSLATDEQKQHLIQLFEMLGQNVLVNVSDAEKRKAFGKTLYGIHESIIIDKWVTENVDEIIAIENQEELLTAVWPILESHISSNLFNKIIPKDILVNVALAWVKGASFNEIYQLLVESSASVVTGTRTRAITIDNVVELCENALAFDSTLAIGAIIECLKISRPDCNRTIIDLMELQKRMRYGLPAGSAIVLYEMGFADRVIALEISEIIVATKKRSIIRALKWNISSVMKILSLYPSYYNERLNSLLK